MKDTWQILITHIKYRKFVLYLELDRSVTTLFASYICACPTFIRVNCIRIYENGVWMYLTRLLPLHLSYLIHKAALIRMMTLSYESNQTSRMYCFSCTV